MDPKNNERAQARNLYFGSNMTQQQIADLLSINRKTLRGWMSEGNWKEIKYTTSSAPGVLISQYYNQLGALNRHIAERTEQPWPTKEEADTIKKLNQTINQAKKGRGSMVETIEVFETFVDTLRSEKNVPLLLDVIPIMDKHVKSLMEKGKHLSFATTLADADQDEKEYAEWLASREAATPNNPAANCSVQSVSAANPPLDASAVAEGAKVDLADAGTTAQPSSAPDSQCHSEPAEEPTPDSTQNNGTTMGSPSKSQNIDNDQTTEKISTEKNENARPGSSLGVTPANTEDSQAANQQNIPEPPEDKEGYPPKNRNEDIK